MDKYILDIDHRLRILVLTDLSLRHYKRVDVDGIAAGQEEPVPGNPDCQSMLDSLSKAGNAVDGFTIGFVVGHVKSIYCRCRPVYGDVDNPPGP